MAAAMARASAEATIGAPGTPGAQAPALGAAAPWRPPLLQVARGAALAAVGRDAPTEATAARQVLHLHAADRPLHIGATGERALVQAARLAGEAEVTTSQPGFAPGVGLSARLAAAGVVAPGTQVRAGWQPLAAALVAPAEPSAPAAQPAGTTAESPRPRGAARALDGRALSELPGGPVIAPAASPGRWPAALARPVAVWQQAEVALAAPCRRPRQWGRSAGEPSTPRSSRRPRPPRRSPPGLRSPGPP
ncbi:MAG: hypothetical protein H6706_27340 [Myxococcales bacterium]|nr:hypothetical protein [Myxococcales bacterium]